MLTIARAIQNTQEIEESLSDFSFRYEGAGALGEDFSFLRAYEEYVEELEEEEYWQEYKPKFIEYQEQLGWLAWEWGLTEDPDEYRFEEAQGLEEYLYPSWGSPERAEDREWEDFLLED